MEIKSSTARGFAPQYLRGNRRGGRKTLKCFPFCDQPVHKKGITCGDAIRFLISDSVPIERELLVWGRFKLLSAPSCFGDAGETARDAPSEFRDEPSADPLNPNYRGIVSNKNNFRAAVFPKQLYHYGWVGGRYKTDELHVFEATLLDAQTRQIYAVSTTPSFTVCSSRRADPNDKVRRRAPRSAGESTGSSPPSGSSRKRTVESNASSSMSSRDTDHGLGPPAFNVKKSRLMVDSTDASFSDDHTREHTPRSEQLFEPMATQDDLDLFAEFDELIDGEGCLLKTEAELFAITGVPESSLVHAGFAKRVDVATFQMTSKGADALAQRKLECEAENEFLVKALDLLKIRI